MNFPLTPLPQRVLLETRCCGGVPATCAPLRLCLASSAHAWRASRWRCHSHDPPRGKFAWLPGPLRPWYPNQLRRRRWQGSLVSHPEGLGGLPLVAVLRRPTAHGGALGARGAVRLLQSVRSNCRQAAFIHPTDFLCRGIGKKHVKRAIASLIALEVVRSCRQGTPGNNVPPASNDTGGRAASFTSFAQGLLLEYPPLFVFLSRIPLGRCSARQATNDISVSKLYSTVFKAEGRRKFLKLSPS